MSYYVFVRFYLILLVIGTKHSPGNLKHSCRWIIQILFYVFVMYVVKTSSAPECTLPHWRLSVYFVIALKSHTIFVSLFKLLTFQSLAENSQINLHLCKAFNFYKFSYQNANFRRLLLFYCWLNFMWSSSAAVLSMVVLYMLQCYIIMSGFRLCS